MNSVNPLVSIIVPIYNVESYIQQCIESLINQTYKNIEVILVDDGSLDNSPMICDKYSRQDSRIVVIHKLNGGLSSSRRAGIEKAIGQYLMFVDGDDWIDLVTVEHCIERVKSNINLSCVLFSYAKEYPEKSIPMSIMDESCEMSSGEARDKVYRRLFGLLEDELAHPERMHMMESCCMKLYRTEFARRGRFFDSREVGSSEDALFNMYALHNSGSMAYINEPHYHYRKVPQSITNSFRPNLVSQWNRLFDIMRDIIDEKQLGQRYMDALSNRIALSIFGIGFNELERPNVSSAEHVRQLTRYLRSKRYQEAIKKIDTKNMPIKWKCFLLSAKVKLTMLVYLELEIMKKLRRKSVG